VRSRIFSSFLLSHLMFRGSWIVLLVGRGGPEVASGHPARLPFCFSSLPPFLPRSKPGFRTLCSQASLFPDFFPPNPPLGFFSLEPFFIHRSFGKVFVYTFFRFNRLYESPFNLRLLFWVLFLPREWFFFPPPCTQKNCLTTLTALCSESLGLDSYIFFFRSVPLRRSYPNAPCGRSSLFFFGSPHPELQLFLSALPAR